MECHQYRGDRLDVDYYPSFLSDEESKELYRLIELQWPSKPNKRINTTFGDKGVKYTVQFGGYGSRPLSTVVRHAREWKLLGSDLLRQIRDRLSKMTEQQYNYCVVQRYPNGKIGIPSHRDKEMKSGTIIAGISLGSTRELHLALPRVAGNLQLELPNGSLYLLNPPTNDFWTHSISVDPSINDVRISLTFRYTE